jgi:hypothetical protein
MTVLAQSRFKVADWDEQAYAELENGGKLTHARVKQSFSGDIEGDGTVEWLMCYRPDKTADFIGLQHIAGRIGQRSGSFVLLQTRGTFDGKEARGILSVVPGSGTGTCAGCAARASSPRRSGPRQR